MFGLGAHFSTSTTTTHAVSSSTGVLNGITHLDGATAETTSGGASHGAEMPYSGAGASDASSQTAPSVASSAWSSRASFSLFSGSGDGRVRGEGARGGMLFGAGGGVGGGGGGKFWVDQEQDRDDDDCLVV